MTTQLTDQQIAEITARATAATPGPWEEHTPYGPDFYAYLRGPYLRGVGTLNFGDGEDAAADREFVKHAREDVDALLAEVRRLNAYLAGLEPAAMHARTALAALCYDLDDPGADALGALHLIQQATVGVECPKDDAAAALARRDAEVMRRCAEFVRDTYFGDDVGDAAATLERDADVVERGCGSEEGTARGLANCPRCGRLSARHPIPLGFEPAVVGSV